MQVPQPHRTPELLEQEPEVHRFEDLGIDAKEAAEWRAAGFGPFEAALAHGDGFTASIAVHYRHQLKQTARSWAREGLDSEEGLGWHRAGFTAKDAARWRAKGADVETARSRRSGYGTRELVREGAAPADRSAGTPTRMQ